MKINLILSVTLLVIASAARVNADPALKANPNPVIVPAGQTQGTTTLTWNAEVAKGNVCWVTVSVVALMGTAQERLAASVEEIGIDDGADGTLEATVEVGKSYDFRFYTIDKMQLYVSGPAKAQLLASLTVTVVVQRSVPVRPAFIYAITADGTLQWRRYDGNADGGGYDTWQGPKDVGTGWGNFKQVFPGGGNVIYAITQDGTLKQYIHLGHNTGLGLDENGWLDPRDLAEGWGDFKKAFAGGDNVIYAITQDGILKWYKYTGFINGQATLEGPKDVGRGWGDFKDVFSGGEGIIYAITQDGKLQWRKYNGYLTGGGYDTWQGPTEVSGSGWSDFKRVFSSGNGIIYAITQDGKLEWREHRTFKDGVLVADCKSYVPRDFCLQFNGRPVWQGRREVGRGWGDFLLVFAQP